MTACIYCGHPADQRDHIVARSRGGGDEPRNLAPACLSCNSAKGDRTVEYFLRDHPNVMDRVRRHQAGEDVLTGLEPGERPRAAPVERVALTIKLSREDWLRVKKISIAQRTSMQDLALEAFSKLLVAAGDAPIVPMDT